MRCFRWGFWFGNAVSWFDLWGQGWLVEGGFWLGSFRSWGRAKYDEPSTDGCKVWETWWVWSLVLHWQSIVVLCLDKGVVYRVTFTLSGIAVATCSQGTWSLSPYMSYFRGENDCHWNGWVVLRELWCRPFTMIQCSKVYSIAPERMRHFRECFEELG